MNLFCPLLSNPDVKKEFDELVDLFGEDTAYYFGDRTKALLAKKKVYTHEFFNWFGDWTAEEKENVSKVVDENGEPLVVWHGTRTSDSIKTNGFDKSMSGKGNRGANN